MSGNQKTYRLAEMVSANIPPLYKLQTLLQDPQVEISNVHDAIMLVLDILIQEENFVRCTSIDKWKKKHYYSISYTHPVSGELTCQIKYLPTDPFSVVFATTQTTAVAKMWFNPHHYIQNFKDRDPSKFLKNISKLNKLFKDNIVQKMVAGVCEFVGIYPPPGLASLATELKFEILYKMDAKSLAALSAASKEFRELIELPSTWQHALFRDFPEHRNKVEGNWKELYKIEYARLLKLRAEQRAQEEERRRKDPRHRELRWYMGDHEPFGLTSNWGIRFDSELFNPVPRNARLRMSNMARPNFSMF